MLKLFNIIIILICFTSLSFAVNDPELPKDPSSGVEFNDSGDRIYHANIYCADKGEQNGVIYFRLQDISFVYQGKINTISINNLRTVEFIEWKENLQNKNEYVFYPSKITITMKDNMQYTIGALPQFNNLQFSGQNGKVNLYCYFYDYLVNGKWKNANQTDRNYPSKNPLPGTLTRIEFIDNSKGKIPLLFDNIFNKNK